MTSAALWSVWVPQQAAEMHLPYACAFSMQAPARRQHTQEAYAKVAALFAAAGQADAEAAPAASRSGDDVASDSTGAAAEEEGVVQLQLSVEEDRQRVAVRLLPATPAASATPIAPPAGSAAGGSPPQLEWQLRLAPRPDGGMAAVLVPVEIGAEAAPPTAESQLSGAAGSGNCASASSGSGSSGMSSSMGEGSVAAVVAAARFLHHQLNELKSDVAAARLALLKEAILGNGSAIEYERERYLRALRQPAEGGAGGSSSGDTGSPGSSAATEAVADAFPLTAAWLKETLQQVRRAALSAVTVELERDAREP